MSLSAPRCVCPADVSVLVPYNTLPGFWKFMYRVSPFTYFVEGILSTAVANAPVVCDTSELQRFQPPAGETCGSYMQAYQSIAGGYLVDDSATSNCEFCQLSNTNVFLQNFGIKYSNRWRDFGLIWVFIIVNVAGAVLLYWLARVVSVLTIFHRFATNSQPKKSGKEEGVVSPDGEKKLAGPDDPNKSS